MNLTHIVHGISFKRTGKCNHCGACCVNEDCRHFSWDSEIGVCDIYETLGDVCILCTEDKTCDFYNDGKPITHKMCADFPQHPWLVVIKSGKCGYAFTRLDDKGKVSDEPLPFLDME